MQRPEARLIVLAFTWCLAAALSAVCKDAQLKPELKNTSHKASFHTDKQMPLAAPVKALLINFLKYEH